MSDGKKDETGELDDEHLADVTGGLSVGVPPEPGATEPGVPDLSPSLAGAPRDAASGLPTGKRMHKPFVITDPDPTMS
jgi:hypothetical protein